jgi:hypothetical protein
MNEPLAQDKQELIREVAEAALIELEKLEKRRIQVSPQEMLKELFGGMRNPKPAEENFIPVHPMPVMLPEWPKLKVRFDYATGGEAQEWIVVNNGNEEAPYHAGGWFTVWPPNSLLQIQGKAGSLESHVEKLKADGVKERPAEDWQRRKEAASKK